MLADTATSTKQTKSKTAARPMANTSKTRWPELLGKPYSEAEAAILADNPDLKVSKVLPGQMMSRDFRRDRVRIMVDANEKVIQEPSVG